MLTNYLRGWPVSRILSGRHDTARDDHSSRMPVTRHPLAANPDLLGFKHPRLTARGPYLALLPVGLAVPLLLPVARWALTPPFHRDHACMAVCSLWRFPWGYPRRVLPGTVLCGVRTFLGPVTARSHPAIRAKLQLGPSRVHVNGETFGKIGDHAGINAVNGARGTGPKAQAECFA